MPCRIILPKEPAACVQRDDSRPEWLRCRLVDCEAREGYLAELRAAMSGCVE